jgi:hypothetical protein
VDFAVRTANGHGDAPVADQCLLKGLARWRDEYTDVPVVTELAPGDPAQALVTASRGAALVFATFPCCERSSQAQALIFALPRVRYHR